MLVALVATGLGFGGRNPLVVSGLVVLSLVTWLLSLASTLTGRSTYRPSPVALAALALALLALLRGSTLGAFMAGDAAQAGSGLWPNVEPTGAVTPGAAAYEALRLIGLATLADSAAMRLGSTSGWRTMLKALVLTSTTAMVVGVVHHVGGLPGIFGLNVAMTSSASNPGLAAPFVNPNLGGSFAVLGATAALVGAALAAQAWVRLGGLLLATGLVTFAAANAARGALAAVAVATAVGLCTWLLRGRLQRRTWIATTVGLAVGLAGLAALGAFVLPVEWTGLSAKSIEKLAFWRQALAASPAAGLWGWGPGSFLDVAPEVIPMTQGYRGVHPESDPLAMVFDHGWLATVSLFVGAIAAAARFVQLALRAGLDREAWAAVVFAALLAVDAMLGLTLTSYCLAGWWMALGAVALRAAGGEAVPSRIGGRMPAGVVATALGVALLGCAPQLPESLSFARRWLASPFSKGWTDTISPEERRARIEAFAAQSPRRVEVVAAEGRRANDAGEPDRAAVIDGWLERHAPLERSSLRFRISQALTAGEDKRVCALTRTLLETANPGLNRPIWLLDGTRPATSWLPCIPATDTAEAAVLATLRDRKDLSGELQAAMHFGARSLDRVAPRQQAADVALRQGNLTVADLMIRRSEAMAPDSDVTLRLRLRWLVASKRWREAVEASDEAVRRFAGRWEFASLRMDALSGAGRDKVAIEGWQERLDADVRTMRSSYESSEAALATIYAREARVALEFGDLDLASRALARAWTHEPGNARHPEQLGDIAARRGLREEAQRRYREAMELAPANQGLRRKYDALPRDP